MKFYSMLKVVSLACGVALLAGISFAESEPEKDKSYLEQHPLKEGAKLGPETPVALVNGTPITKAEFDRAMDGYLRQFKQMTGSMHGKVAQPNEQMKADVLEQLIDREILYQESAKTPVEDADKQVDEELAALRQRYEDEAKFKEALSAQGMDEASLRDLMGRQIQVRHYIETQIVPGLDVGDDKIEQFYKENEDKFKVAEQVRCSHILIRSEQSASEEDKQAARKKAEEIQVRCAKGEDFAELAKEFSEDPGSAQGGGDLGFFTRDRMVAPFSEAAFALQPGEVSDVVETRFGFHIIKLVERQEAKTQTLDEVKERTAWSSSLVRR